MLKRAFEHPCQDFHVAMRMHAEALAGRDDVFIDDAKLAKAHVIRVVVLVERKAEMGVEPADFVVPTLVAGPDSDHFGLQFGFFAFRDGYSMTQTASRF